MSIENAKEYAVAAQRNAHPDDRLQNIAKAIF
jgi:hypothetical protein